jgi:hypothetical protein
LAGLTRTARGLRYGCATRRAVALRRRIFKRKKGFAKLSLGLIYHSKALPQPPSRDTVPLISLIFSSVSWFASMQNKRKNAFFHFEAQMCQQKTHGSP